MVANERTIRLVSEWDSILVEKPQANQPVLNTLLKLARKGTVRRDEVLDFYLFTNMRHYESKANIQRQDTVMLHSNVAQSPDLKIRALKKWGLWFNENNMLNTTL
jgi:hypothetical protein